MAWPTASLRPPTARHRRPGLPARAVIARFPASATTCRKRRPSHSPTQSPNLRATANGAAEFPLKFPPPIPRLEVISFGSFRLFSSARRLEKDGVPVKIGSRALDILIVLVEKPGE